MYTRQGKGPACKAGIGCQLKSKQALKQPVSWTLVTDRSEEERPVDDIKVKMKLAVSLCWVYWLLFSASSLSEFMKIILVTLLA